MARRLGSTDAQIAALSRAEYELFEPGWRASFEWADAVTPTAAHPSRDAFDRLAAHWSPAQIVEITAVITIFNYFNRFANALDIPPTK